MHEWDCVLNCNNTLIFFKALLISENAKLFINQNIGEHPNKGLLNVE